MMELSFNNVMKYLDATLVFTNITFNIYEGEKVGVVGENGCGKTTLLKLISGIESLTRDDAGSIFMPRGKTVGYLQQIHSFDEYLKVKDILNIAFQKLKDLEKRMKELEKSMTTLKDKDLEKALKIYSTLTEEYEVIGGYEQEEKFSKVCEGLSFDELFLNKSFDILSGGEKTRVVLGKILLENPDILLLDEPTNHLDIHSTEWLEGYLKTYKGIVIIVSHDRYFLDNVVNKIIDIEDKECKTYNGNYSNFVKQKEEDMLIQFHQYKEQQKQFKAIEKKIKELRDWAIRADNNKFFRRAASLQIKLDKMKAAKNPYGEEESYRSRGNYGGKIDKPKFERETIKLTFKEEDRSANRVIFGENISKSYKDKNLLENAELLITIKERVALIGDNGSGKTTFLKMLLGEESFNGGDLNLGDNVKYAYLPQTITFNNEDLRVLDCFRDGITILEGKAREYLSKFMFFESDVFKKVKHLSGGERVRLKLAQLLFTDINLLILDEPTNHLDINSIEVLENSLENFNGTLLFISHDRYFINKVSSRIIAIENKRFTTYNGNYDFYKEEKAKQIAPIADIKKHVVEKVKRTKPVDEEKLRRKEIEKLEKKISELEENMSELDSQMEVHKLDYEKLNDIYIEKEKIKIELDKTIELWSNYEDAI